MAAEALIDAGVFIGALLRGDPRHVEARDIVDKARTGQIPAVTTVSILCEVYAALTWEQAQPRQTPAVASSSVMAIVQSPSKIRLLPETPDILSGILELGKKHKLNARRIHDARHASTALLHGIHDIMTYDIADWKLFEMDGLKVVGPDSVLNF